MAKKKLKKFLKGAAKAALIGGALYAGVKGLGKRGLKGNAKKLTEGDIGIGQRAPRVDDYQYKPKKVEHFDPHFYAGNKEGGRISKKDGGRTGKQFGGGLNRPVARPVGGVAGPVGGVGAPVRPLAYKHGGHVKSMGVAKRGGGVAKR